MIGAEHEGRRPATGAGFNDAVTFAFGDGETELFGLARIGLRPEPSPAASALAVVFADGEVVAALAEGESEVADPAWEAIDVAGVHMEVVEPLREWRVAAAATGGGFDLRFTAASPPIELGPDDSAARLGGMEGYEQLCRVEGSASVQGTARPVACLGQRSHGWGVARWEQLELARTVCAWWDEAHALTLSAVRPAGASGHDQEAISAFLVDDGPAPTVVAVAEPRLSTTYDAAGRQRRAGLELWVGEDDELPRRAAGLVACGTSLELGALRLDCSFFRWRMEGRVGVGRYDVLRRA